MRIAPRNGLVAALDVGSTKICCFIARVTEDGRGRVTGIGHHLSRGLRGGSIIDMEAAEAAILTTVHAAEQMAGETIQEVVVNLSGGYPASQTLGIEVAIAGHEIGDAAPSKARTSAASSTRSRSATPSTAAAASATRAACSASGSASTCMS